MEQLLDKTDFLVDQVEVVVEMHILLDQELSTKGMQVEEIIAQIQIMHQAAAVEQVVLGHMEYLPILQVMVGQEFMYL